MNATLFLSAALFALLAVVADFPLFWVPAILCLAAGVLTDDRGNTQG